jgi:hypothetical protein
MSTKTQDAQSQKPSSNVPAVVNPEKPNFNQKQQETEIKALLNPSAEQRLENAKKFNLLSERYSHLKRKQDELHAFSISNDNTEEKFKLTNSTGFVFQSSNTEVINKIVSVLSDYLTERISTTKNEILDFTV